MSKHILDRPVYNALTTRQAEFGLGNGLARRFRPDISPLASARDDSAEALADLAKLVPEGGTLLVVQADPVIAPPGTVVLRAATCVQMIADKLTYQASAPESQIEPLTERDWPEMHRLATLTRPGPFEKSTATLGEFFGIREKSSQGNGKILAMAGERMRVPGFEEMSGVCVDPSARGRGYARVLSAFVAGRILARGSTAFLHSYAENAAAIGLYESLGFRVRATVNVVTIARDLPKGPLA